MIAPERALLRRCSAAAAARGSRSRGVPLHLLHHLTAAAVGAGRRRAVGARGRGMSDAPLRLGLVGCGRLAELGYAPAARARAGRRDRRRRRSRPHAPRRSSRRKLGASGARAHRASCSPPARSTGSSSARRPSTTRRSPRWPPHAGLDGARREAAGARRRRRAAARGADAGAVARLQPPLRPGPASSPRRVPAGRRPRAAAWCCTTAATSWRPVQRGDDALLDLGAAPHRPRAVSHRRAAARRARARHARARRDRARDDARGRCGSSARPTARTASSSRSATRGGRRVGRASARRARARRRWPRLTPGAHPLVRSLTRAARGLRRARCAARTPACWRRPPRAPRSCACSTPRAARTPSAARRSPVEGDGRRSRRVDLRPAVRRRERRGRRSDARRRAPAGARGARSSAAGGWRSQTPADHFAAGAFHTLYSGVELGDHGLFYPFQWDAGAQRARYMTAFPAPPAIWERLARAGLRTLAIDPYESRPPRDWRGTYVCGWRLSPTASCCRAGRCRARPARSSPGATARPARDGDLRPPDGARAARAAREARRGAGPRRRRRRRAARAASRYDLAWLTFSAAHLAGPPVLGSLAARRRSPRAASASCCASALEDVYAAVDAAFGRVLAALPGDCDVIVASAVGMDVNSSRADLLPQMLAAVLRGGPLPADGDGGAGRDLAPARGDPAAARAARSRGRCPTASRSSSPRAWSCAASTGRRPPAFCHPGRQPGLHPPEPARPRARRDRRPGRGRRAAARRSPRACATFRDPDGAPAVARVDRVAEHHAGARADQLPDLVVQLERAARDDARRRALAGASATCCAAATGSGRSGNHTPGDAWAVVAPGAHGRARRRPARRAWPTSPATVAAVCGVDGDGLAGESLLGER